MTFKPLIILIFILMCIIGVASAAPTIDFEPPTPADNSKIYIDYCTINATITETALERFGFNIDGVYFDIYNDNLVLCMPLNNIAAIGETTTTAIDISVSGNDGTSGLIDWSSSGTSGMFNGAVYFDNDADVIIVPTDDSLNVSQITVGAYVDPTTLGRFSTIIDKGTYYLKILDDNTVHFGGKGACNPYNWDEVKSNTTERWVQSLAEFDGYFYTGTGLSAVVSRSLTGAAGSWVEVFDSPDPADNQFYSLIEYNESLYVTTGSIGKIYNTTDGTTWNLAYDSPAYYMYCSAVFNDYLYVGSGSTGLLYRCSDSGWNQIYDFPSGSDYIRSLAEFDGYLYAGTGNNGKIYRSLDGTTWAEVHDDTELYIYGLEVHNGSIYGSTGNGAKIIRSSDGTTWNEVYDGTGLYIHAIKSFNGSLFISESENGKIYMSHTGDSGTWIEIENTDETYMFVLEEFNKCLYLGTGTPAAGKIFKMSNGFDVYSTSVIGTGYTQITGTYDGTTSSLYIDGVLDNSVSELGIGQNNNNLTIGESFRGRIDEVRIYNTSLTAPEIAASYNASIHQIDTDKYGYINYLTDLARGIHSYYTFVENTAAETNTTDTQHFRACIDATAPVITDIEAYSLSDEIVRIKWEVNNTNTCTCNNVVYYSLDETDIYPTIDQYVCMSVWDNGTLSPKIQIDDLINSKNYFYRVYSTDCCDNNATSAMQDFYTGMGTNRMPVIVYLACCVLVFILIGATVVLRTNKEYLDVLTGMLSIFLAYMCAQLSISQKVYTAYSEITSTDETILVYDIFNSIFVHWFFMLVATLMVLYVVFLIMEIIIYTYKNIIDRRYNDL